MLSRICQEKNQKKIKLISAQLNNIKCFDNLLTKAVVLLNNLKAARKAKGMTQTEVAKAIGLTQNGYSYWENGKAKIDKDQLIKLATLFEVSTDYLLGVESKETPIPTVEDGQDDQEKELLALIKDLSSDQKDFLLAQLKTLTGQGK